MDVFFNKNHLNQDKLTYEYCHGAYLNYLKSGKLPFVISGWDVNNKIVTPVNILNSILTDIKINVNKYYLIEDDIGKSEIVQYLSKHSIHVKTTQVLVANSATSLLCYAIFSVTSDKNGVLVLNPTYYSTNDSLLLMKRNFISIGISLSKMSYDCNKIEHILQSSSINTIVLTDPIFGSGIPISADNYNSIIYLANKYHCTLIVDLARYGLIWNEKKEPIIGERLTYLKKAEKYVVIYSPCKKIFANGIKTGILISSENIAETLAYYSDSVLGSVSAAQIEFLKILLSENSEHYIYNQMENNVNQIKSQYEIIKSIILNSSLDILKPKMGHYALASFPLGGKTYQNVFDILLNKAHAYTLPMELYGISDDTSYLFRINLLSELDELVPVLWDILAILERS